MAFMVRAFSDVLRERVCTRSRSNALRERSHSMRTRFNALCVRTETLIKCATATDLYINTG